MKSAVGMKSVPADIVVFDELDETPPAAKAMARERLAHSDYKRMVELSNPSLPDYGIDEAYQASDQRHWTLKCPACGHWTALDKEFPRKLNQEVSIILPREDESYYRACPKCSAELDLSAGEWVADFPGRPIHGYRISQLFSPKVDPGEILGEYRTARYPDRFYNLKIGIPWADLERRLDEATVLACCGDHVMEEQPDRDALYAMGVDTGRDLHVVILKTPWPRGQRPPSWNAPHEVVYIGVCPSFEELQRLRERFRLSHIVIDGLPETHATRTFVANCGASAHMCFFSESQRGEPDWDRREHMVVVNRTEALDASRAAIREKHITLPRRSPIVETFARHMSCDAKVLDEDEETGIKRFRYVRVGENHYSMAFTYACLAVSGRRIPWIEML
jgi:hypothetical protein